MGHNQHPQLPRLATGLFYPRHSEESTLHSSKKRFFYSEEKHPDLQNKVDLLESHGLVVDVTPGNAPMYRMTEDFVGLLMVMEV